MKILVTGGAGFIGLNLIARLLKKGYKVDIVDNLITSSIKNLDNLPKNGNWKFHNIGIEKFKTSEKFDSIFHLACPTGVPNCQKLALEMVSACSMGTKNILEIAKKSKANFIFTSSSEVYGDPQIFPQTESYFGNVDPTGFRAPYEEGKRFSETLITSYVKKFGLEAKILRLFNTYGPYMQVEDSRVIPRFITQANKNLALTVHGDGNQTRTFCYVDDLVGGLILIAEKGKSGEVYNIGSDKEVKIKDFAQKVIKLSHSNSKLEFVKKPYADHQRRRPDLTKIKKLGWMPKTSLDDGLKKTIIHFENISNN